MIRGTLVTLALALVLAAPAGQQTAGVNTSAPHGVDVGSAAPGGSTPGQGGDGVIRLGDSAAGWDTLDVGVGGTGGRN